MTTLNNISPWIKPDENGLYLTIIRRSWKSEWPHRVILSTDPLAGRRAIEAKLKAWSLSSEQNE
jgi:hypothetical protein